MVNLDLVAFGALLIVYVVYSAWHRLDPRYPIAGGLLLLLVAALVDASGAYALAEELGSYVFLTLGAGVLLYLVSYARELRAGSAGNGPRDPTAEASEPAHEG